MSDDSNGRFDREPASKAEMITVAVVLSIVIGLFLVEIIDNYKPVKLTVPFIIGFWMILLFFHEAGHAIAAALLGWRVGKIVLGIGKTITHFRIGGALVEVRMFPVEGFVTAVPTDLNRPQLKDALFYFAGPAMDLLVALLVLFVLGADKLFTRSSEIDVLLWQSLALAGASQGLLNLIPHAVLTANGRIANDGLGIIWCLTTPKITYAETIGRRYEPEEQPSEKNSKDRE